MNEKYLFYYKLDLYINDLYFKDFTVYFSFWISTVHQSLKIGATAAAWPQAFPCKKCKHTHFLNH